MSASGPSGPLVLSSTDLFRNKFLKKILSATFTGCQMVWTPIKTDSVEPDLCPNCLQRLSSDDKSCRWQGKSKPCKIVKKLLVYIRSSDASKYQDS